MPSNVHWWNCSQKPVRKASIFEDAMLEVGRGLHHWSPPWPGQAPLHMVKNRRSQCLSLAFSFSAMFLWFYKNLPSRKTSPRDYRQLHTNGNNKPHTYAVWPDCSTGEYFSSLSSSCQLSPTYLSSLTLLALCLHLRSCPVLCCSICSLNIGRFIKEVSLPVSLSSKGLSVNLCLNNWIFIMPKNSIGPSLLSYLPSVFLMHAAFLGLWQIPLPPHPQCCSCHSSLSCTPSPLLLISTHQSFMP